MKTKTELLATVDRVTAERDAARARINELLEDFQEISDQADRRGVQASEFEGRMGDLQVKNGKLQQRLNVADQRADDLQTQLEALEQRRRAEFEAGQAAERRVEVLEGLLRRVVASSVLSFERDAPEELEGLEVDICAALKPTAEGALKPEEGGGDDSQRI